MDERLTALLLGDLPAEQAAELRAHLAGCDACRSAAAEIEATLNLLRGTLAAQAAREPAAFLATGRLAQIRLAAAHPATPPVESTAPGRFWHLLVGTTDREKQARRQLLVWASAASFVAAVFLSGLFFGRVASEPAAKGRYGIATQGELRDEVAGAVAAPKAQVTMEELKIKELLPAVSKSVAKQFQWDYKSPKARRSIQGEDAGRAGGTADARQPELPASQDANADCDGMASTTPEPKMHIGLADTANDFANGITDGTAPSDDISAIENSQKNASVDQMYLVSADTGAGNRGNQLVGNVAAPSRDTLLEKWTIEAWVRPDATSSRKLVSRKVAAKPASVSVVPVVATGGKRPTPPEKKTGIQNEVVPAAQSERLSRSRLGVAKDEIEEESGAQAVPPADKLDRAQKVAQVAVAAEADAEQEAAAAPAATIPMAMPEPEPAVIPPPPSAPVRPFVTTRDEAFSTFAIDVDTAAYALARAELQAGRLPVPEAVRVEEFVNAFDYDYTPPAGGQAFAIAAEFAPSPFRPSLSLLKLGVKGAQLGRANRQALVLTVILDASGSMNSPDRLGLARQALKELLGQLRDDDRIALVQFSAEPRLLLEATPAAQRQTIVAALDGIQAAGSTHLENGLRTGYAVAARAFRPGAANRVLFLSDGVANLGAADADSLLKAVADYRRQGICLSVYGVGSGAYNDALLEQLADKGDGTYTFFDSLAEARRVLVDQFDASMFTIAKDVKIQVEFNPARVTSWRQIGYDNRQLTKEQFRDDSVDAGEIGAGQAVTALYELALAGRGDESLGTVRVRYRDPASGAVREIQQTLTRREGYARFAQAPPRFRLAAGVAEFAELLRGSPFVEGSSLREVDAVLQPVALDLKLDGSVQELVRLLRLAERMRK